MAKAPVASVSADMEVPGMETWIPLSAGAPAPLGSSATWPVIRALAWSPTGVAGSYGLSWPGAPQAASSTAARTARTCVTERYMGVPLWDLLPRP